MFFKKRHQGVRKCPNGHVMDPEWDQCPYCAGQQSAVFLDESRAAHRPAQHERPPATAEPGDEEALPPLPPLQPPPSPAPPPPSAAKPPPAKPSMTPPTADPDMTQISRPGPAPRPPVTARPPSPLPMASPPPATGSGPPPLVEWSNAQGRPAPPHQAPSPPLDGAVPPAAPPLGTPPAAQPHDPPPAAPAAASPRHHHVGSLDEPTRVLSAAPSGGGLTIAWLVGTSGALRGQDFRIQPGGARIGRLNTCGICLHQSQDFGISKEHAEVRIGAGTCILVDLGSANGTFVNGERISERALQDGDRVRLGLLEFVYKCLVL